MAEDNRQSFVSHKTPRLLSESETVQSLKHWEALAEVFYSKDTSYETFFEPGAAWAPSEANYGQQEEAAGLRRSAAKKGRHLKNLLVMLSSHVPWPHVQDKILKRHAAI